MAKSDPLYIDLHGYRVEEIDDLMEAITRMINEQAGLGIYLLNQETKKLKFEQFEEKKQLVSY